MASEPRSIAATEITYLSAEVAWDTETDEPRVLVYIEDYDGTMSAGALTIADARDLHERLGAVLAEHDADA